MRVFISGGCKNGKSTLAQKLAKAMRRQGRPLYYVATMRPGDDEDIERIARHRAEREGWGFDTVEAPSDIAGILGMCDAKGAFLLDSVTALLANEMFPLGGEYTECAAEKVCSQLSLLIQDIKDIVIVSDYIYSDALFFDSLTDAYKKGLAAVDSMLVQKCDTVVEVCASVPLVYKGSLEGCIW